MADNVAVSVVIPTYNRAHLLRRALRSVIAQTHRDWECVVVDDGSHDATPAVVADFDDERIVLLRHPSRQGASAARNTGIAVSTGEYVAFLDSDDEWAPRKLELQLLKFETSSFVDVGLVYSGCAIVRDRGGAVETPPQHRGYIYHALLRRNVIGSTSVAVVRRDVLKYCGGFDCNLPAKQDRDLWLRIARRHAIDFVPDTLQTVHVASGENRITADGVARVRARSLFFEKYRSDLARIGICHHYHFRTGWICLRMLEDGASARRAYVSAIRAKRTYFRAYVMWAYARLPLQLQELIVRWSKRTVRWAKNVHSTAETIGRVV